MEKEYSLGTSNEVIVKAATSLSTIGVAYSVITQVQNGQSIAKLESGRDDGGKIELKPIGTAGELRGGYVKFKTVIHFPEEPIPLEELLDKVRIQFVLDGGYAGKQFYYPDSDDITVMMGGKLVAIEEKIKMI